MEKDKKKTILIIIIFAVFYLFTNIFVNYVLNNTNLKHNLIHKDSSVVGSRWVYHNSK
jgi:hypothetical protein